VPALLAERHRRHRLAEPLLPKRFEEVQSATAEIEDVWRRKETSGAAAVSDALACWASRPPSRRLAGPASAALTAAVFGWARGRGHAAITTDWRATNLLAARFWPRRGFWPAFLPLHRSIP
jgi:hypothetical protein